MKDRILEDIVEAHREKCPDREPGELARMSVGEILKQAKYMNREELRAWLFDKGNIRGVRIPVEKDMKLCQRCEKDAPMSRWAKYCEPCGREREREGGRKGGQTTSRTTPGIRVGKHE